MIIWKTKLYGDQQTRGYDGLGDGAINYKGSRRQFQVGGALFYADMSGVLYTFIQTLRNEHTDMY